MASKAIGARDAGNDVQGPATPYGAHERSARSEFSSLSQPQESINNTDTGARDAAADQTREGEQWNNTSSTGRWDHLLELGLADTRPSSAVSGCQCLAAVSH